jgi:hypothetical protein
MNYMSLIAGLKKTVLLFPDKILECGVLETPMQVQRLAAKYLRPWRAGASSHLDAANCASCLAAALEGRTEASSRFKPACFSREAGQAQCCLSASLTSTRFDSTFAISTSVLRRLRFYLSTRVKSVILITD